MSSYLTFSPLPRTRQGGHFLRHWLSSVSFPANAPIYIRYGALCCLDFPPRTSSKRWDSLLRKAKTRIHVPIISLQILTQLRKYRTYLAHKVNAISALKIMYTGFIPTLIPVIINHINTLYPFDLRIERRVEEQWKG